MQWLSYAWHDVLELLLQHLVLTIPAIALAAVVATPLGYLAARRPRLGAPILSAVALTYCIPALPLLVLVPGIFGLQLRSNATVIIALAIYGAALMARSAHDAFVAVPEEVRESVVAMGASPLYVALKVDLPLAIPVLAAGLRVVVVSTVSLATIGALVGVPSLGQLFTDGFKRGIVAELVTGIVVVVALALLLDALVQLAARLATPWEEKK